MKNIFAALVLLSATPAFADGFKCENVANNIAVKVFNYTHAEDGTRTGATMILSDPSVQVGRKTIAKFTDINNTLSSKSAVYVAKVDLRFADSNRAGERVADTKLGELKQIIVDVDFTYAAPVEAGESVNGALVLVKRNGEELSYDLNCVRYLKGE